MPINQRITFFLSSAKILCAFASFIRDDSNLKFVLQNCKSSFFKMSFYSFVDIACHSLCFCHSSNPGRKTTVFKHCSADLLQERILVTKYCRLQSLNWVAKQELAQIAIKKKTCKSLTVFTPIFNYQCGSRQVTGRIFPGVIKSHQGHVLCVCSTENEVFTKISLKTNSVNALDTSAWGKRGYICTTTLGKNKGINIKVTLCAHLPLDIFPDHFTTFHFSVSSAAYLYAVGTPQS